MTDYAGAVGRIALDRVAKLGPAYMLQPKHDGTYCRVHLDSQGRIASLFSRREQITGPSIRGLMGAMVGAPHSQLVGELELWTEASVRMVATRGYRLIHLFDCIRDGEKYMSRETYRTRYDALHRMRAEAELRAPSRPWARDSEGDAHSKRDGKYCAAMPTHWRLAPLVEQLPVAQFDRAWREWVELPGGEGLVAVAQHAPMGARRAKIKIKQLDTLDCVVVKADAKRAHCIFAGQVFAVGIPKNTTVTVGGKVEIAHNGFYESSPTPKFARMVRSRSDL